MIQDIGPLRLDNSYRVAEPRPEDLVVACRGGSLLMREEGGRLALPRFMDWHVCAAALLPRYLLGVGEARLFLAEADPLPLPDGYAFESVMRLRSLAPRWLAYAAAVGHQLGGWYVSNRFCGRCGAELGHVRGSRELACPACAEVVYPRINPAVIVGVCHEGRLLLTKYAGRSYTSFALVAGFCEVGETVEQTARREVREEVGLALGGLCYFGSQPWPFSSSLLMGFFAEVEGDPTIRVDQRELALGQWAGREEVERVVRERGDSSSLTSAMMRAFAEGAAPLPAGTGC